MPHAISRELKLDRGSFNTCSLVYSTREMVVGYDSARNRVGALAIAKKAVVTPVMLKEAPKLQC